LAITVVASFATAGITAWHFGEVAPATLLVSVPLSILIPPLMVFSWGALLPGLAGRAFALLFVGFDAVERFVVMEAAELPGAPIYVNPWLAPAIALAGIAGLLVFVGGWRTALAAAALGAATVGLPPRPPMGRVELWVHSVKHGLAATVIFPDGSAAQVDAGSRDEPAIARTTLAPALWGLGIARFEAISISHDDADHANAYADLLLRFPADRAVARRGTIWEPSLRGVPRDARSTSLRLERGGAVAEWFLVDPGPLAKTNDREIVASLAFAGRRILLPGDLESDGVDALVAARRPLPVDVLILPHHGLDNGQVDRLLDATHPSIAIASNGERYSIARTESKLRARGLRLLTTRDLGTLRVRIEADGSVAVTANPTIGAWPFQTQTGR
jgi:competence protein ComEC